ncbi:MAG: sigma-70 family RNA polymerase sigma factor, partial [Planctomycetes bacterium]|nr:sigma-70 family RNA polymerase sigma factor [Planctomycetota bacterium]
MIRRHVDLEFDAIVRQTQLKIRAYIAGMGVFPHDVDDVSQDVYMEFYKNMEKIPPDVPVEAWLKGIARNLCRNHFRRSARRDRLHDQAVAEILARTSSGAERLLDSTDVGIALEGCFHKLPEESRRMLAMRYAEDMSSGAIADALGSTAEAVRSAL